jgi:Fe-S-cluster-containing dehydrogenase component
MVLNPDVSIRSRGIMEKCSMCIQRIQEGKLKCKKEEELLKMVISNCMSARMSNRCNRTFGDKNDKNSKIAKMIGHDRNYVVLQELNVQSSVSYMTKIRNK